MRNVLAWIVSTAAVACSVCALAAGTAAADSQADSQVVPLGYALAAGAAVAPVAQLGSAQNAITATNHASSAVNDAQNAAPRQPIGY